MKKNLTSLFFILVSLILSKDLFAQNVKIEGNVNKPNSMIRLLTYNDMLTYEQTQLFMTNSDNNGNFLITADIDDITMAQIAVDLERVDILLKPNSEYKIKINIPEQNNHLSYFERPAPSMEIVQSNDDGLYYQYHVSNVVIDDFLLNNFNSLYRGRKMSLLDSLNAELERDLGEIKSDFVKDNITYRIASIQMMLDNDNAKKVVNQYFNDKEILYSNPAYMSLFQEIFTNYLSAKLYNPSELRNMLYADSDVFYKYIMEKDVFLSENKDLADLILSSNLRRMYYEMPDDKERMLVHLNYLKNKVVNAKNQKVISDIIKQMNHLSFNTAAPSFSLKDKDQKTVNLSDYKDELVLLQFVNRNHPMAAHQFEMLDEMHRQWQDTIQIMTIATQESFEDFVGLFENKNYDWNLLNLGDDILLLEKYNIKTFPDYVIIGKNSTVGMAPAPSPDQYLDFHVRRLYKYHKK